MPARASSSSLRLRSASAVGAEFLVEGDRAAKHGGADLQRVGDGGRGRSDRVDARLEVREEPGAVLQERADDGEGPGADVQGGRRLRDRLLDERPGHVREGAEGRVQVDEHLRLLLGDGCNLGRRRGERVDELHEPRVRVAQVLRYRLQVLERLRQLAERGVQVESAAGEGIAELHQVRLDRLGGRLVEGREHVVELDGLGLVCGERDRLADLELVGGAAAVDLQVLRPRADRARITILESFGIGWASSSSVRSNSAVTVPSSWETGVTSLTTPTRTPPMRTSLPGTSELALGTSAEMLYVGTNGRPEFALYARKTATTAIRTVIEPTIVGLAASVEPTLRLTSTPPRRRGSRALCPCPSRWCREFSPGVPPSNSVAGSVSVARCRHRPWLPREPLRAARGSKNSRWAAGAGRRCRCEK